MARSISEIKESMTRVFMADEAVRELYEIEEGRSFDECFSVVSIENVLFYAVAACCHVLEVIFDNHKREVEEKISRAVVASVPWYHKMALMFQYGDRLVLDENTQQFVYEEVVPQKRIVKYVAVRDRGTSIQMLVAGEMNGRPVPLEEEVLTAFKSYMNRVKIAGVILAIRSLQADLIAVRAVVYIDPMVIGRDGARIENGSRPVEVAVENYLKGIVYGGTFNKTRLVDAMQVVDGVIDVELMECAYSTDGGDTYKVITGNNYTAVGGSFVASGLANSLSYVVGN